jgi:hypothetical protein
MAKDELVEVRVTVPKRAPVGVGICPAQDVRTGRRYYAVVQQFVEGNYVVLSVHDDAAGAMAEAEHELVTWVALNEMSDALPKQ